MQAIAAATAPGDGLACFNRMYLQVTQEVNSKLCQGFFADPGFMTALDVAFANLCFGAAAAADPAAVPLAWRPLIEQRAAAGIEPVQSPPPRRFSPRPPEASSPGPEGRRRMYSS